MFNVVVNKTKQVTFNIVSESKNFLNEELCLCHDILFCSAPT